MTKTNYYSAVDATFRFVAAFTTRINALYTAMVDGVQSGYIGETWAKKTHCNCGQSF